MENLTKLERCIDGKEYYTVEVGQGGRKSDICEILQEAGACRRLSGSSCKTCIINKVINRLAQLEHKEAPSLMEKNQLLDEFRRCWNCDFCEKGIDYRCLNPKSSYFLISVRSINYCGEFCPQRLFDQIVGELLSREEKQG